MDSQLEFFETTKVGTPVSSESRVWRQLPEEAIKQLSETLARLLIKNLASLTQKNKDDDEQH